MITWVSMMFFSAADSPVVTLSVTVVSYPFTSTIESA